jgi:gamma-glutamylcyclotransferase (GGCT)/AIG2-like uncharacterized protein YtfP
MKENLFSYGTLQKNEVQLKLFGRLLNGARDILKGCKLSLVEITDESFLAKGEEKFQRTLVPSENETDFVEGMAFEMTEEELLLADKYEPDNYERKKVALLSGKEAWVYVARKDLTLL